MPMSSNEHQKQKAQCECGCIIGKYKIKRHRLSWQHHYFMGSLDAYYQQQNNITNKYESS
jgi:hypothetical protein